MARNLLQFHDGLAEHEGKSEGNLVELLNMKQRRLLSRYRTVSKCSNLRNTLQTLKEERVTSSLLLTLTFCAKNLMMV